jgi:hypothetical protein
MKLTAAVLQQIKLSPNSDHATGANECFRCLCACMHQANCKTKHHRSASPPRLPPFSASAGVISRGSGGWGPIEDEGPTGSRARKAKQMECRHALVSPRTSAALTSWLVHTTPGEQQTRSSKDSVKKGEAALHERDDHEVYGRARACVC